MRHGAQIESGTMLIDLRFALLPALQLVTIITLGAGGYWPWLSIFLGAFIYLFFDETGADIRSVSTKDHVLWLNGIIYVITILTFVIMVFFIIHAQRHADDFLALYSAAVAAGIQLSLIAGTAGHEFAHRTHSPWPMSLGRALFAFSMRFDVPIEHVFGHHRSVGTRRDPATAPRGMPFWIFLPHSIAGSFGNAARFEHARLANKGRGLFHWRNRFLQGLLMSAGIVAAFWVFAGWPGVIAVLFSAMISAIIIELFNYIAHYGLVRVEGTRIAARHSWNSYRTITTSAMLNLPRHSDHHLKPTAAYWELEPHSDSPVLPRGSGIMALAAMFPPVYFYMIQHQLVDWDNRLASKGELALLNNEPAHQLPEGRIFRA